MSIYESQNSWQRLCFSCVVWTDVWLAVVHSRTFLFRVTLTGSSRTEGFFLQLLFPSCLQWRSEWAAQTTSCVLPLTRGVFPKLTDCSLRCDFENGLTQKKNKNKKNGGGEEDENTGLSQMTAHLKSVFRGRKASVFHNGFGYCSIMKYNGGGGGRKGRGGGEGRVRWRRRGSFGNAGRGRRLNNVWARNPFDTVLSLCRLHQSDRPHFFFFYCTIVLKINPF